MTSFGKSFGWKRKAGENICKKQLIAFESDTAEEDAEVKSGDVDWINLAAKRRVISLEDALIKSERLRKEGTTLADSERYWEAIKKWDEAIQFNPLDERLYEMKAQALLILCEVFPAVFTAEKAIQAKPTWWVAYQTMGRAQLGLGEVKLALRYFQKAVHLNPTEKELWDEDLKWVQSLLEKKMTLEKQQSDKKVDGVEISEVVSEDDLLLDQTDSELCEGNSSTNIETDHEKEIRIVPKGYVHMRH